MLFRSSVTLLALGKNFAEVDIVNSAPLAEQVRDTPLNPLIIQALRHRRVLPNIPDLAKRLSYG